MFPDGKCTIDENVFVCVESERSYFFGGFPPHKWNHIVKLSNLFKLEGLKSECDRTCSRVVLYTYESKTSAGITYVRAQINYFVYKIRLLSKYGIIVFSYSVP